jgi:enoyl-CoA hydratase
MNTLAISTQARVTTILLNRSEARNAVDGETAKALFDAFTAFDRDPDSDVAVLGGLNDTFCAGADLKAFSNPFDEDLNACAPMGCTRLQLSKPVIAAISGYAVAGGMELALWADLRVMETSATFGIFCRRFGVPLIDGGTIRLPRLIGMSRALDLILTGRAVDSTEALAIGLANRVVPEGTCIEQAQMLAKQIASFPQLCMRNDRTSAYKQWGMSERDALGQEFTLGKQTLDSGESKEGAARFAQGQGRGGQFCC